jgi:predicted  nucleic acid-binding Zn-ribbon protein
LAAQRRLLDLQRLDTGLDQVTHRRAHLPEAAKLSACEAELAERSAELVRARTAADDLARAQRKADADVEQVRIRRDRDQARLDSGGGGAKELEGLSHELVSLARRQSDLEDIVLEVMERLESANAEVERAQTAVDQLTEARAAAERELAAATSQLDQQTAELAAERGLVAGDIEPPLLELYEKVRAGANAGGIAAVALRNGRCEGCRMDISPTELRTLNALPPDAIVRCEDCRRILVRVELGGQS